MTEPRTFTVCIRVPEVGIEVTGTVDARSAGALVAETLLEFDRHRDEEERRLFGIVDTPDA